MRYTTENTSRIGKPVRVFDANGNELKYCTAADTDTGEVERLQVDANGEFVVAADGNIARYNTIVPGGRVE